MSASRRKHLLHASTTHNLAPNQSIVRVIAPKGSNVFQVAFPSGDTTSVTLPARFNKLLYVKRGGYLIVETSEEAAASGVAVTGFVVAVLYDDDVKGLKKSGEWPPEFDDQERTRPLPPEDNDDNQEGTNDDDLPPIPCNHRRQPPPAHSDSTSSDDDD